VAVFGIRRLRFSFLLSEYWLVGSSLTIFVTGPEKTVKFGWKL
jgi:hypothetical protein